MKLMIMSKAFYLKYNNCIIGTFFINLVSLLCEFSRDIKRFRRYNKGRTLFPTKTKP